MLMFWCVAPLSLALAAEPKKIVLDADDTVITDSCTLVVRPGTVIADKAGDGVVIIRANNVVVTFEGAVLRGAAEGTPWDTLSGCGIRVDGSANVTIKNARVSGYKVGVRASNADGLTVDTADLSDNYRQRLKSTPAAEDASDWFFPHQNDEHQWVTQHGAALCVENSSNVTVSGVKVRRGQNGIILDRVNASKIHSNDCSFLSGWGLAMWRSSRNTVSRNAFDFCVRGYSHGVYNRGQDSAGILCFEQCNENVFVENSATHGGDGFFGFAGQEAIGETDSKTPGFDPVGKGCNNNILIDNDFSYAAAHGIEMTFSTGNRFLRNRLVGNAICGVWGGYSRDTVIALNTIEHNGEMAYGAERGGINIEHGSGNAIIENTFANNACGVHLWWDNDAALLARPAIKAAYRGVSGNTIAGNTFDGDAVALQLRDAGASNLKDNSFIGNSIRNAGKEIDATPGSEPRTSGEVSPIQLPKVEPLGKRRVVGARPNLAGREFIVMTEWGPYSHDEPLVREAVSPPGTRVFEMYRTPPGMRIDLTGDGVQGVVKRAAKPGTPSTYTVNATIPGVVPYSVRMESKLYQAEFAGTIFNASWDTKFFAWTDATDPRDHLDAWRALADAESAVAVRTESLNFAFGGRGPSDLKLDPALTAAKLRPDRFGLVASSSVKIGKGTWKITALSDDGIRVRVNGKPVIENWTWHGPTPDTGTFTMDADGVAEIVVEYFEIDGYAVLQFGVEPAT